MTEPTPEDVPISEGEEALIALSGGPDSSTLLEWAIDRGIDVRPINFDQGLKYSDAELTAAKKIANRHDLPVETFDVSTINSMLGAAPFYIHSEAQNLRFGAAVVLSISVCHAIAENVPHVLVATHRDDAEESLEYSAEFLDPMEEAIELAASGERDLPQVEPVQLHAPFSHMRKSDVLALGRDLGVPFEDTWSCIVGRDVQCGGCGACGARQMGFKEAGIVDPTTYKVTNTISGSRSAVTSDDD